MATATKLDEQDSLFERLKEVWPSEVVEPFGEVLIIPTKAFKSEWKTKLESESVKVFVSNYGRESCFFLRKKPNNEAENQIKAETQPIKRKRRKWSSEEIEDLQRLRNEGLPHREIAKHFSRSVHAINHKLLELEKTENPKIKQDKPSIETKNCSLEDDVVKEILEACSLLYPTHKNACAFLLREASNKILEA